MVGILLYEALTGESPFRAETPFLTVQRLVHDEPRPIAEIAPSLPAGLASLVHQLLAKEPLLRPRDFHEVADAMIELAGDAGDAPCRGGASLDGLPRPGEDGRSTEDSVAPARSLRSAPPPAPAPASVRAPRRRRRRVAALGVASLALAALGALVVGHLLRGGHSIVHIAVLDTDDLGSGGHTDGALLAAEVRNAVEIDMWRRDGLVLIPRGDIESYVRGVRATGKSPKQDGIQAAVGADEVLAIDLRCVPGSGSCAVTLQRSTSATDRPPLESFHLATDGLRPPNETVADYLAKLYPDHPVRHAGRAAAIDPESHARYLQLVQAYYGTEGGAPSSEAVLDEIARIRQRSPGSLDVLLFEAELLRHRYLQTDDPRTAQLAKERLDAADHLLPDSYGILSARFDLELSAGWLDEAYADLDRLTRLDPDSSTTHLQQAKSYYQRREYKAARGDVDAAVHRNPFSWRVYYYRALVFRALNDRYDTRAAIHDLLVRSPDNYGGLSLLAREERRDGRLVCAEQIYQKLVDREPSTTSASTSATCGSCSAGTVRRRRALTARSRSGLTPPGRGSIAPSRSCSPVTPTPPAPSCASCASCSPASGATIPAARCRATTSSSRPRPSATSAAPTLPRPTMHAPTSNSCSPLQTTLTRCTPRRRSMRTWAITSRPCST